MKYLMFFLIFTISVNAQYKEDKNCKQERKVKYTTPTSIAEVNSRECVDKMKYTDLCVCGGEMVGCEDNKFCVKCSKETKEKSDAWINIGHPKDWVWWEWLIAGATALGYLLLVRLALTGN